MSQPELRRVDCKTFLIKTVKANRTQGMTYEALTQAALNAGYQKALIKASILALHFELVLIKGRSGLWYYGKKIPTWQKSI